MTGLEILLGAVVLYLVLSPPNWDPAISWKEVQMGVRKSFFGKADYTKWK